MTARSYPRFPQAVSLTSAQKINANCPDQGKVGVDLGWALLDRNGKAIGSATAADKFSATLSSRLGRARIFVDTGGRRLPPRGCESDVETAMLRDDSGNGGGR